MIRIDKATALELLEQAVAERGADYRYKYPVCAYVQRDSAIDVRPHPACIVGLALSLAGVPIETLEQLEGDVEEAASELGAFHGVKVDAGAVRVWLAAQVTQDTFDLGRGRDRHTWGEALEAAKQAAEE